MRTAALCIMVLAFMCAATVSAGDGPAWFDMEKCGFCKHLMEDAELLDHCIWEHHKIDNGMVSVTTVDKEYLPSFRTAMKKMEETGKKMETGEMVPMCGMCTSMGALMMKGAKFDAIETKVGSVLILTGTTPELVAEIHGICDKNNEELKKLEAKGMHE